MKSIICLFIKIYFLLFILIHTINIAQANEKTKMVDYLLIGAKGRAANRGAVFKCNLDGTKCTEFLGGLTKFKDPLDHKLQSVKLLSGDHFGSSIFATQEKIFIGAMGRDNRKATDAGTVSSANYKDEIGALFQCDLDGSECREILGGHIGFPKPKNPDHYPISLMAGDNFGVSLAATDKKLFIGILNRNTVNNDDVGGVITCDLSAKNCEESFGGKTKKSKNIKYFKAYDNFASGLFISKSHIYIGAKNKNEGNGAVYKCTVDLQKCSELNVKNLDLYSNDSFGTTLAGNAEHLFVGAIGRNGLPRILSSLFDIGAVFRCSLKDDKCVEFIGGELEKYVPQFALAADAHMGTGLAVNSEFIFIGASGRKNSNGIRTGAVFRCKLDGTDCLEIVGGKNEGALKKSDIELAKDDLLGSSLAILSLPEGT